MRILIAGGTGFIGTKLTKELLNKGHYVDCLTRHNNEFNNSKTIFWDPYNQIIDLSQLEGYDAIINLTGESVSSKRWNTKIKQKIYSSRIETTSFLVQTMEQLKKKPEVFINASAIGYYGNRPEETVTEESPFGNDFLAHVCNDWENAAFSVHNDIRTITLRCGLVLSTLGGALQHMLPIFRLGIGGVIGSGKQYISWITLDDLCAIFLEILQNKNIYGPVNAVSPEPVTNLTFTKTLGRILKRPTYLPLPAFITRLALGERADALLLASIKAYPKKLIDSGFVFKDILLSDALKKIIDDKL